MIYRVHRAKTFLRCGTPACFKLIPPKERYTVQITPPEHGKKGWSRRKLCRRCRKIANEQIQ